MRTFSTLTSFPTRTNALTGEVLYTSSLSCSAEMAQHHHNLATSLQRSHSQSACQPACCAQSSELQSTLTMNGNSVVLVPILTSMRPGPYCSERMKMPQYVLPLHIFVAIVTKSCNSEYIETDLAQATNSDVFTSALQDLTHHFYMCKSAYH